MSHVGAADSDHVATKPSTPRRRASSGFGSARGNALGVMAAAKVWIAFLCFGATSTMAWALGGQYLYTGETFVKDYTGPAASEGNYTLSTDKNRVVEFYSPYCGHCQQFKATYVAVAESVPDVEFYAVSCVAHRDVCQANNIRSWPSIYTFPKGSNEKSAWKGRGGTGFNAEAVKAVFGDAKTDQEGAEATTAKGDEEDDDDDDDTADETTDTGVAQPRSPVQERIQEAHARFVERKKLVDGSLVAARKARLSELESSGAVTGENGGPSKVRPGAALAVKDASDVNRFKGELSQRRRDSGPSRLFTRDQAKSTPELKAPPTGATVTMRANQLLTEEYRSRREQLIASIRKHRGAARAKEVEAKLNEVENALDVNQNAARSAVPFQKEVTKARLVEKIPFVKRVVKMSHEEELILDVSMSFIQGLKAGVFKSRKALSQTEQVALEDWLHLLRVTLPSEWALHNLIDDLLDHFSSVVKSHEALVGVLEKHPLHRDHWSLSCSPPGKVGGGFTCGFWKLLHVMTVGLAEHRGGEYVIKLRMARQDSVLFSPELAADTVREYIANFFPCTACAEHFTERFDDCSYRRCSRLSDKVSKTTDADWKELAKWLWEFHNEVSIRVLHEKADNDRKKSQRSNLLRAEQGPGAAAIKDEIAALYPSIHDCLTCYNGDGSWNEDAVFVFLERQYWPAATMDKRTSRLLTFENDSQSDREFNLTVILVVLGVVLLCALRDSLVGKSKFHEALLRARAMRPRMVAGSRKRSV